MKKILLFYPHIPKDTPSKVAETLRTRWIGQGPKVDQFEKNFSDKFSNGNPCIGVGSGTDALHLAYILAGIKHGDEVITPVFTCTATNIPLLYLGARIKFADVDVNTLNMSIGHVNELITEKTKAIVCVHYGGLPCDMDSLVKLSDRYGIPLIQDSAHAIGAKYNGQVLTEFSDFSCYSFQAIKSITTGDGGMLVLKNKEIAEKAKRMRWFGIDRKKKSKGIWENDITEIGYKYQMTDLAATMGISGLENFDEHLKYRRQLHAHYRKKLEKIPGIKIVNDRNDKYFHAAWLNTIIVSGRKDLEKKLAENGIESNQVHYRNDRYSIFSEYKNKNLVNMNSVENKYLVLPMHAKITISDIDKIADVISSGW